MKISAFSAACAAALLLLAGCETPVAQPLDGANPYDVEFITNAEQIIMFDRAEGELVGSQAESPEIRDFALDLVRQANEIDARIKPVAQRLGIRLPDVLRYDLRVRLGHMRYQHGLDFDRTYVEDQVASHVEFVRMTEAIPASGASASMKAIAAESSAIIKHNTDRLVALQRKMILAGL
jgi:predicted outer membrane protein